MALIMKHLKKFCLLLILVAILVATSQGKRNNDNSHHKSRRQASNVNHPRRFRRQVAAAQDQHLVVAPAFDQQIAPNMIPDEVADETDNEQNNIHRREDLNPTSNLMVDPHLLKAPAAEGENESDKAFVHDVSEHLARGSSYNSLEHQMEEFKEDKLRERKDDNAGEWENLQSALGDQGSHDDFHHPEDESQKPIERREPVPDSESSHPDFDAKNNEATGESEFTRNPSVDKLRPIPNLQKAEEPSHPQEESNDETPPSDDDSFTLFTIANTDIGTDYNKIPYREQYRWDDSLSNCASFNLKIPDEKAEKSVVKLCIFRPYLEFPDETELFNLNPENGTETKAEEKLVYGYVMNRPGSTVRGRIQNNRYFFGEISFPDVHKEDAQVIYFVEDIHSVFKRMHINDKSLRHMLMVMTAKNNKTSTSPSQTSSHSSKNDTRKQLVYNAAVTKGVSLNTLLDKETNPNNTPFLMLTTNHNSYIILKEPQMWRERDGKFGKIKWGIDPDTTTIEIDLDGAVHMKTPTQDYTFRPNGRTIVSEGTSNVQTLQEHEGPVAITAYSKQTQYDCVLPTPAFEVQRKGGYVCKVCVVTDKQFAEAYDFKIENATSLTQNYMGKIIDQVSWMFRTVDWNTDKHPDNVGLSFESQPIDWRYPSEIGDEAVSEQILVQSLQEMNLPDDCCLGIGYTMKRISKREDGKGHGDKVKNEAGRVCNREEGKPPNNMIVISANANQPSLPVGPLPESKLVYLTAHKVALAFGANLDGSGQDVCDQFVDEKKHTRHYLMWPDKLRNTTLREQTLSQCSISEIKITLGTCHSSCFDNDEHPFCGNGLTEDGEECDCGSEYQCTKQTCCYSRYGERPCMKTGIGCKAGASTLIASGMSSLTLLTLFVTYYRISW